MGVLMHRQIIKSIRPFVAHITLLFFIALLAYVTVHDSIIYSDDWDYIVRRYIFGQLR